MLKKYFVLIFFSVLLLSFFPQTCLAGSNRTVTLIYTGDVYGMITPVPE